MEQENVYKELLDNLNEGVYFVAPDRTILYWNQAAERITGFKFADVVGRYCWDNIMRHVNEQGEELCFKKCPLIMSMLSGQSYEAEVYLQHKDGHRLPVQVRCSPNVDKFGRMSGGIEVFSDNSDKKEIDRRKNELEKIAFKDPLTNLGNHRSLDHSLEAKLGELRRYDWPFGVLFIDIDHFKDVNDTFGHKIGDEVLKIVAQTLESNLRVSDVPGRWGGEEFLVLATNVAGEPLALIAEKLRQMVRTAGVRLEDGSTVGVTISVGATNALPDDDQDTLLSRADSLMYASKEAGRDRVTVG